MIARVRAMCFRSRLPSSGAPLCTAQMLDQQGWGHPMRLLSMPQATASAKSLTRHGSFAQIAGQGRRHAVGEPRPDRVAKRSNARCTTGSVALGDVQA